MSCSISSLLTLPAFDARPQSSSPVSGIHLTVDAFSSPCRVELGAGKFIPAFEEGLRGMKVQSSTATFLNEGLSQPPCKPPA